MFFCVYCQHFRIFVGVSPIHSVVATDDFASNLKTLAMR